MIVDLNDEDISKKYAFQSINNRDNKSQSGIVLHFITNSNSVKISFNMKYIAVEPFKGPIGTNGIYYIISTPEGKFIRCNDLYYKNEEYIEESINENDSKVPMYYQIYLPVFKDIYNFKLMLDDDCNIKEVDFSNTILVIGSSVTKGEGCLLPASVFPNELAILLKSKVYSIADDNFYRLYDEFGDHIESIKKINPQTIIIEYMFKKDVHILFNIVERIKDLCEKILIITNDTSINIVSQDVTMIRTDSISDDGNISNNVVNDYFNYELTKLIIKELKGASHD